MPPSKSKRGRPAKAPAELRTERLEIRVTPSELKAIRQAAKDRGRQVAALARELIREGLGGHD